MKAKDIPDEMILKLLAPHQGRWTFWTRDTPEEHAAGRQKWADNLRARGLDPTLRDYPLLHIPPEIPFKVYFAKLRALHRRGLIGGCTCGCRGDFEITDKGLELIGIERTKPYTGY